MTCSIGLCVGVAAASWIDDYAILGTMGLVVGGALSFKLGLQSIASFMLAAAVGVLIVHYHPLTVPESVQSRLNHTQDWRVTVRSVESRRLERQRATGTVDDDMKVSLTLPGFPIVRPGDQLSINGKLKEPENFNGFDYRSTLAAKGIHATLYARTFELERSQHTWARTFDGIKSRLINSATKPLTEPAGSFVAGVLLGERSAIPDQLTDAFRRTGTSHVLALSGYNISVILGCVVVLLGRRPLMIAIAIGTVALFVCIVGPSPPVIRAALMGSLLILSQMLGRPVLAIRLCVLTAALTLLIDPWALRYDVGWQLSFLATLGILLAAKPLATRLAMLPALIREPLAVTVAAGLFTAPVIMMTFGTTSIVAPLANLIVVPLIPIVMALGAVTALLQLIVPPAAILPGMVTDLLARTTLGTVEVLSSFRFASVTIPSSATSWAAAITTLASLGWCYRMRAADNA